MRQVRLFAIMFPLLLMSCTNISNNAETHDTTPYQQDLLDEGWEYSKMEGNEMTEGYGYEPEYGFQDNYFDITLGEGSDCIVKIMDTQTNKCIRQAFVAGGSSTTISQIPQKRVYLKLAYGKDLMEYKTDTMTICKFTTDAFYERTATVFDFGKKNSQEVINYTLEINVTMGTEMHNFETSPISEEEFMK